jgi:WD40 repeat protein
LLTAGWVAYSPDGRRLLGAGGAYPPTFIHHLDTGKTHRLEKWPKGVKPPNSGYAVFSPGGDRVLVCYHDGTARVWDPSSSGATAAPLRHAAGEFRGEFSRDGRLVVTGSRDGVVQVWEAATGRLVGQPLRAAGVNRVAFHPDGHRVAVCMGSEALIWDPRGGQGVKLPHPGGVVWAAFSPDGNRVVTACADGTGRVWETDTGRQATALLQHSGTVLLVAFSPDGKTVLTAGQDNTARLWNAATGQATTPPLQHARRMTAACFSPDGTMVLTGSRDGTARVWDVATGEPVTPPLRHLVYPNVAAFRPDGRQLVTNEGAGLVCLWDFSPQERPLEELVRLARVLSGTRLDAQGRLHPLTAREYEENWRALRTKAK